MAFVEWRERQITVTGTTTKDIMPLVAGDMVCVFGVRVITAASAATSYAISGDWAGLGIMASADVGATVAGFKRNATPYPFLVTVAGNLEATMSGVTGTPEILIFAAVAKAFPGAGEV